MKGKNLLKRFLCRTDMSAIAATIILTVIFAIGSSEFLSQYNIFNVSRTAALYMFVALGQAFVLIVGGMNLSLGNIGALSVVAFGYCSEVLHLPLAVSIIACLLTGGICGFLNGIIIVKLKLNAFIVTLATSFIYTGLVTGISRGYTYTEIPQNFFLIGRTKLLQLPSLFWIMIIVAIFVWLFFKYTVFGRRLLATGGNESAARLSGIKTEKIILIAHVLSGVFAAVAGSFWIARMGSASPTTGGDWMMISFAVAVIGGTALSGGEISPLGLVFASFLMALIKNGLIMVNADMYFEQSFLGIIILASVCFETVRLSYTKRKNI